MERGRVLWFSREKGFGVIEATDGGRLVVDHTGIRANGNGARGSFQTLEPDVPVEYEVLDGPRIRPRAVEVEVRAEG